MPSAGAALNLAAGASLAPGFNMVAPPIPLNALHKIPHALLKQALSPMNARVTAAATSAMNLTSAKDLATAHERLRMSSHTAVRFAMPHLSSLSNIPAHILAKVALAAQLIAAVIEQGLSPYNASHLQRFAPHAKSNLALAAKANANTRISASLFGGANPLLAVLTLATRLGLNIHSAADLRLAGHALARFAGAGLKLNTHLNAAFAATNALNAVGALQSTFNEQLFSASSAAWQRVHTKLAQFANASHSSLRGQHFNRHKAGAKLRGNARLSAKAKYSASLKAWQGVPIPPEVADWLRIARAPVVRAAAHAAIRLGLAVSPGFVGTEAAIGLVLALSSAMNYSLTCACCGICDGLKNGQLPPVSPVNLNSAIPQLPTPNVRLPF